MCGVRRVGVLGRERLLPRQGERREANCSIGHGEPQPLCCNSCSALHHDNAVNTNSPPRRYFTMACESPDEDPFGLRLMLVALYLLQVGNRGAAKCHEYLALATESSAPHHRRVSWPIRCQATAQGSAWLSARALAGHQKGRQPHIPASRSSAAILYG